MRIIRKDQAEKFKNSENCVATEYRMGDKDMNGAVVEITGRYPAVGRAVNLECKELVYVVKGSGRVIIEDEEINLEEGDLILIEPGEKYFWDGNLTTFASCTPPWRQEQHKEVE